MLYFNPKPDFNKLSKYYKFSEPAETMFQQYSDGYPIIIDWYDSDEKVDAIQNRFTEIINDFGLIEHFDNLLFLVLSKIQDVEAIIDELEFQYHQKKRTKELANLLLTYFEAQPKFVNASIHLKTRTGAAKLNDPKLIQWLFDSILKGFKEGTMNIADFEYNIRERFFDDTENGKMLSKTKLNIEANAKIDSPNKSIKALQAEFCLYVYLYLRHETEIIENKNAFLSDKLLNFYFELISLFGYIDPNAIESENKDYMSSLIRNQVNKINT